MKPKWAKIILAINVFIGLGIVLFFCAVKKDLDHPTNAKTERPVETQKDESNKGEFTKKKALSKNYAKSAKATLKSLHKPMGPMQPGDWLMSHPEPGQTFEQYLEINPNIPTDKRHTIYIQPLGNFDQIQRKIITMTAEFMSHYFCLPVKIAKDIPLSTIPKRARRTHPSWGDRQILATYVLYDVLKPRLPKDAISYLALTTSDLWPEDGWNFVFGMASLHDRVGVWSIYRNGDPHQSQESFQTCLLRTLKIATHETGHMFSIQHCTKYECNMCGCNNRSESDRRSIVLCPECVAKIWWANRCNPLDRYQKLAAFAKKHGLNDEAAFYERSYEKLKGL